MRRFIPLAVAALAATGITTAAVTASASAATTPAAASRDASVILPPHAYAPYFEAYDTTDGGLAQLSAESGQKYVSLAFLQTPTAGSCTADWNGDTATPISATVAGSFGADIAAIEARGGTVDPVVRRVQRGHHRHRAGRQLHQRQRDRVGLREPRHHLPRHPDRP